jgi:PAS domain S-box-containing protein
MSIPSTHRRPGLVGLATAGLIAVILLSALTGWIVLRQTQQQAWSRQAVIHTFTVLEAIESLLMRIQALETGQRGYLLTNDVAFLTPYDKARPRVLPELAKLRQMTLDDPSQQRLMTTLEPVVRRKLEHAEHSLALNKIDHAAALAFIALGEDRQLMLAINEHIEALLGQERRLLKQRIRLDEANTRDARTLLFSLLLAGGGLSALLIVLMRREILLRRALAMELQQLSGLLHDVNGSMAQGLVVFDQQLELLHWNQRWLELVDLPAGAAIVGADMATIVRLVTQRNGFTPEHAEVGIRELRELVQNQSNLRNEWVRPDGAWIESLSRPMSGGRTVITYTDITPLKQAQRELQDKATRLNAVLDNALDGIITINESGSIESFNRGAEQLFGYRADDVVQRNIRMLMPEPFGSAHDRYLRHYLNTGERRVIGSRREVEGLKRDGDTFPLEVSVSEIWIGDRHLFIGILRDITERRNVERLKNEFVSTVSHELRTPLTSIAGSLGLLAAGAAGALPDKAERLIRIAHNNSERLVRLINDLLDIEKIESGRVEFRLSPLALRPLVEQAIEANRGYAASLGVELQLAPAAADGMVLADADRLTQVLTNLLSNAAKFSPQAGTVAIDIIDCSDTLRLSVHDDGAGIGEQFRACIFDKFSQADIVDTRQKGGTGLGLSIAKSIVERHGGRIGFESDTQGGGTTFTVDLHKWEEGLHTALQPDQPPRVLVCGSDADSAGLLAAALTEAGLAVEIADSVQMAREWLAQHRYAAMTLDLLLPDGDGLALLKELRDDPATQSLPVIVVSVVADERHRLEHVGSLQVAGWLHQPVHPQDLVAAVCSAADIQPGRRLRVLHVENDPDVIHVVAMALHGVATATPATSVAAATALLRSERFDAVVLDVELPDGSGLELLETLRQQPEPVPVVIFSAQDTDAEIASRVNSALIKSKASIHDLVATIQAYAQPYPPRTDSGPHSGELP